MSNETDAQMLRAIAENVPEGYDVEVLQRVAAQLDSDAKRYADSEKLQAIGKSAFESIAEMVTALECDYDRLEELRAERDSAKDTVDECESDLREEVWDDAIAKGILEVKRDYARTYISDTQEEVDKLTGAAGDCADREDAERRIREDPLSIEVRSGWVAANGSTEDMRPEEFNILLGTGGPATRIIGELNEHGEPTRARLQVQDWFLPWTDYVGGDSETLLTYCRCFYFGEG